MQPRWLTRAGTLRVSAFVLSAVMTAVRPAVALGAAIGTVTALWMSGAVAAESARVAELPAESKGEIHVQVDAVRLLGASGQEQAHLFLGIFRDEVVCKSLEERAGRWIQLQTRLDLLRGDELPPYRQGLELLVPCDEREDPAAVYERRLVTLEVPLPEGVEAFELEVSDQRALRRGLLSRLQKEHKHGLVRAALPSLPVHDGRGLGGPVFCWAANPPETTVLQDGYRVAETAQLRGRFDANPTRAYGLFNPTLILYVEAYGLADAPLPLTLSVFSLGDSTCLIREEAEVRLPSGHAALLRQLDVSGLGAGAYGLELVATPKRAAGTPSASAATASSESASAASASSESASAASASSESSPAASAAEPGEVFRLTGTFQVHWEPGAWQKPRYELRQEASLLLDDERFEAFLRLDPGEQEARLDSMWQSRSRGPGTQIKRLFQERVEGADQRFTVGNRRGSLTDRGKTYIRFGEPDEVHKELMPQDEDQLFYFLGREIDEDESVEMAGRPLRHPLDNSPYQVWYYMNRGEPLFHEWGMVGSGGGLRFVFVDEVGDGNYRLVYTNLLGGVE